MTAGLLARGISVSLGGRRVLDGIDIDVLPGRLIAVVGPNGAGKSTLLKALADDLPIESGSITLNGRPLMAWSPRELALQRAVLPQRPELAFAFRVRDVVELGRHPHRGLVSPVEDECAIRGAMNATDTAPFADRDVSTLSGGEAHRIHYARTLSQIWSPLPDGRTRVLLLDEPTSSLDLFHQHAILAKAREFAEQGTAVLAILHDLNLAAAYADTILVLDKGHAVALGPPADILTPELLRRVWRVACEISIDPASGHVRIFSKPHQPAALRQSAQT